jgi:hypothetical protein
MATTGGILDCGGKRSATPLWKQAGDWTYPVKSAVAAALCQRSPKAAAKNRAHFPAPALFENTP